MERTARRFRPSSAQPTRRLLLALLVLVAASATGPGLSSAPQEPVEQIVIGGVTPRFAVPECVPRTPDERTQQACRTITHDNGGEFARHEIVAERIGLRAFFCDPHSPWQRGSIENSNGRLRRDLPRKTSPAGFTDADIDDVVWSLNATPRKCRGYRTPIEAFAANFGVALET